MKNGIAHFIMMENVSNFFYSRNKVFHRLKNGEFVGSVYRICSLPTKIADSKT